MSASRARRVAVAFVVSLNLILGVVPAVSAADVAPVPTSMAAIGDSITQAASTAGSLGSDAPQNSWSTGWSSSVYSHAERLVLPQSNVHNLSVSGAKVTDLNLTNGQVAKVVALDPDPGYLTVLIGGNDLCTDTVGGMTSESAFETAVTQALSTIYQQSPGTYVYVVSIPDVYQLWKLFKNNFWARFIWSSADICQSLLANPTSTQKVDEDRRLAVRARNLAYNAILARVCDSESFRSRCKHDQDVVFGTPLVASDVSGDYFHPSASGQARLAETSWTRTYRFGNASPTASFTRDCTNLNCSFNASASADSDGSIVSYAWNFGDGSTGTGVTTSRSYEAGGTYTVTLTVTDNVGGTGTSSQSVTVSAESGVTLTVTAYKVKGIQNADLTWIGASGTDVIIHRNGTVIATTTNDGSYTDNIGAKGGGSYTYKVCETTTSKCSSIVSASY